MRKPDGTGIVDAEWERIKEHIIAGNQTPYATHVSLKSVYYVGALWAIRHVRTVVKAHPDDYRPILTPPGEIDAAIEHGWQDRSKKLRAGGTVTDEQLDILQRVFTYGAQCAINESAGRIHNKRHKNKLRLLDDLIQATDVYTYTIEDEVRQEYSQAELKDHPLF